MNVKVIPGTVAEFKKRNKDPLGLFEHYESGVSAARKGYPKKIEKLALKPFSQRVPGREI